ncbi:MAG: VWA domain-containing protein [Planctomycetes bacterium]|nr:VWA domain-containing protein [Planctomycetota bacterium]
MTFVTLSTGLILGAMVLPILLLLYFLRLRRQPLQISSTLLWTSAVEDLHANSPFQRLRPSTLFLLQLLALLLVILALMQPQIEGEQQREGRHIVLIDRSASMNAEEIADVTRFEEAKEQAKALVEQLHGGGIFSSGGSETMIISFADTAEIVSPFTDSEQQLENALASIQPTHGRSSISDALKLARAYMTNVDPEKQGISSSESSQLELFSDGNIADLHEQALKQGETLIYHQVGEAITGNVSIETIAVDRNPESRNEVQVFLSVANHGSEPVTTDIELSIDGIPIGIEKITIPAMDTSETGNAIASIRNLVFVPFELTTQGVVQAHVLHTDVLDLDNIASLVVPPPRELRVLLAEEGAPLLQTALEGLELAELKVVTPQGIQEMIAGGTASSFDVVVTRDVSLETMPRGRYLAFGGEMPVPALRRYAEGEGQVMLVGKEDHPVMRFVRFEEIVATKGNAIVPTSGAQVLLEGSSWPAILHYRGEGRSIVYVAFDPIESNWPYLRSFPFFIYNAVDFLGRSGDVLATTPLQVGDAIVGGVPVGVSSIQIVEPDGAAHAVPIDRDGRFTWGPIRLSGVHRVERTEGVSKIVAVNSPPEESLLASRVEVQIGAAKVDASATRTSSFIQLWPWAIGCVLLVLIIEWRMYQRKVSGSKQHPTDAFGIGK